MNYLEAKNLVSHVGGYLGLDLTARTNKKKYAWPRHIVAGHIHRNSSLTLQNIADLFGFSCYTTVINCLKKDEILSQTDKEYCKLRVKILKVFSKDYDVPVMIKADVLFKLTELAHMEDMSVSKYLERYANSQYEDAKRVEITFEQRVKASFMKHEGRDEAEIAYRLNIPLRQARELIQA